MVSALTIGTGGSGGREGPIMHIGASVASFFGGRLKLKKGDMRTFAIAGAAAGLSAVFRAPLGAANTLSRSRTRTTWSPERSSPP